MFRFFTPGATLQRRIRIVDSCGDVFSDPGANPGASTIRLASGASEANGALSEHSISGESKGCQDSLISLRSLMVP